MARKTGAKTHTHKYHYINLGFGSAWSCALGDCTHYMPPYGNGRIDKRMVGRITRCFGCDNEIHLTEDLLKMDQPTCSACQIAMQQEIRDLNSGIITPKKEETKPIDWSFLQ